MGVVHDDRVALEGTLLYSDNATGRASLFTLRTTAFPTNCHTAADGRNDAKEVTTKHTKYTKVRGRINKTSHQNLTHRQVKCSREASRPNRLHFVYFVCFVV